MNVEDIVKPLIVSPTGFHCKEQIYLSSNYLDTDIERQVKRYNKKLIEEGVDCVLKDLERFETWRTLLFNGYWIKNFTILENLLDWYVFDANTIEFFIKEANKVGSYELEVILTRYRHSRYGAPARVEERFSL